MPFVENHDYPGYDVLDDAAQPPQRYPTPMLRGIDSEDVTEDVVVWIDLVQENGRGGIRPRAIPLNGS